MGDYLKYIQGYTFSEYIYEIWFVTNSLKPVVCLYVLCASLKVLKTGLRSPNKRETLNLYMASDCRMYVLRKFI